MAAGAARGWAAVLGLALVAAGLSVIQPTLLIFVPFALLMLGLPPRRPVLVLVGAVLAGVALVGRGSDALWYVERGWSLLLGAWFVIAVSVLPGVTFLGRALAAVAASAVNTALLLLLRTGGLAELDFAVSSRLHSGATDLSTMFAGLASSEGSNGWLQRLSEAVYRTVELQSLVYPALAALASVAALGVAWWGYRRIAWGDRLPLRPLREFRFNDNLVWLLIGGILLLMLPLGAASTRAGINVLLFMGALYALRGLAVAVALAGAPGPLTVLLGAVALLLLYPIVMAATLVLGLTDTWLDLRARRRTATGPEL